ncbi:Protein zgrf1 [Mactra antiquata]
MAVLYDDKGSRLDTIHVKIDDIVVGEQLESDRYFILIENLKKSNDLLTVSNVSSNVPAVVKPVTTSTLSRARCAGLKRKNKGFMPPRVVKQPCIRDEPDTGEVYPLSNNYREKSAEIGNQQWKPDDKFTLLHEATVCNPVADMEIVSKLPSSNVGKNLMHMYNNYGSSQESSSQESVDPNLFNKRSSPWSVYGSKNNSPNVSNLFKQTTKSIDSPSCEPQDTFSPNQKTDKSVFKENIPQFEANLKSPCFDHVRSEIPLYSNDKHRLDDGFYQKSPQVKERHFEIIADCNSKHNDHDKDNADDTTISHLNININCDNSNSVDEVPDKRNALQILKLLGKNKSAVVDRDFKSNEAHKPNSLSGLTNPIKSIQNITEVRNFHVNLSESPFNSYNEASLDCTLEDGCNEIFDRFDNKMKELDSWNKKVLPEINVVNGSEEMSHPFAMGNTNDVKDSLVDNIIDNNHGTASLDPDNDQRDELSAGYEEVEGMNVEENKETCFKALEDNDKEGNAMDEDLMGSFHIDFSPLSHVTDSESELDLDKIENIDCKEDVSKTCTSNSLLKKTFSVECATVAQKNVDVDSPICYNASGLHSNVSELDGNMIANTSPFLPDIVGLSSYSQHEDILQDNFVDHLKEWKNKDVDCPRKVTSDCVGYNDDGSVKDTNDEAEEKHDDLCDTDNSLKLTLGVENDCEKVVIDVNGMHENVDNEACVNNNLENVCDNQTDIDNWTGSNERDKEDSNHLNYINSKTENESECENNESTQVSSQDTLEFSIGSIHDESQYFTGFPATRNNSLLTDCEMYENKEVDSESEFAFSNWKPVVSEDQYSSDNKNKTAETEHILSRTCDNSPQNKNFKKPYDNDQLSLDKHSEVRLKHSDGNVQISHQMRLNDRYEKSSHQGHGYQVPLKITAYGKNGASLQELSYRGAKRYTQIEKQQNFICVDDISMCDESPLKCIQVIPDERPPHPKELFAKKLKKVANFESSIVTNESSRMDVTSNSTQSDYSLSCVSSAVVSKLHSFRDTNNQSVEDKTILEDNLHYIQPHCNNIMTRYKESILQHSPFQTLSDSIVNHNSTPLLYDDSCFDEERADNKFQPKEYRTVSYQEQANKINGGLLRMSTEEKLQSNSDEDEIYQQLYQPRILYNRNKDSTGYVDCSKTSLCTNYIPDIVDNLQTGELKEYKYGNALLHEKVAELVDHGSCSKSAAFKIQGKHVHPNSIEYGIQNVDCEKYTRDAPHSNNDIRFSSASKYEDNTELPSNNNIKHHGQPISWNNLISPESGHLEQSSGIQAIKKINAQTERKLSCDNDGRQDIDKVNVDTRWRMFIESQESDDADIDILDIADRVKESNIVKGFTVLDNSPGLYDTQSNKIFPSNTYNTFRSRLVARGAKNDNFEATSPPISVANDKGLICNIPQKIFVNKKSYEYCIDSEPANQKGSSDGLTRNRIDEMNENVKSCPDQNSQLLFSCDSFDDILEDEFFYIGGLTDHPVKSGVKQTDAPSVRKAESSKSPGVVEEEVVTASGSSDDCVANIETSQDNSSIHEEVESVSISKESNGVDNLVTDGQSNTQTSETVFEDINDRNKIDKSTPKTSNITSNSISSSNEMDKILVVESANEEIARISNGESEMDGEGATNNSMDSNECSKIGRSDNVDNKATAMRSFDSNECGKKVNSFKFSLDESLDLSFDFNSTKSLQIKNTPCSQKPTQKPMMRIGWRPPVKGTLNVNENDVKISSTNIVKDSKVENSQKMKPTFKCLRLINDIPKKDSFKGLTETENEPKCVDNDDKNIVDNNFETGFSDDASSIKNADNMKKGLGKENQQVKQTPVVSINQRQVQSSQCVCQTALRFPNKSETEKLQNILRQVMIPATFTSVNNYKQIITASLIEYLNTNLLDVSRRYHHALSKVDMSTYCSSQTKGYQGTNVNNPNPVCQCGVPSKMICVKKEGPNCGRYFYACSANRNQQCKWADENRKGGNSSGSKRKISDIGGLNQYMKDQHVPFYGECQIIKRTKETINKYFKAPKWARNREADIPSKKQILLKLSYKGRSSMYTKDDIWVISHQLDFNPTHTFIAKSTYYGPSSSLEVEIEPIYGYCPSNWQSGALCHAILAMNASTELSCIDNIREHIQTQSPPVLPQLLNRKGDADSLQISSKGFQVPRSVSGPQTTNHAYLHCEQLDDLVYEYINKYNLNTDQSEAIRRVANMFSMEKSTNLDNVLLIHGVFGAGKSFLLSVMVLFLVQVFEMNDSVSPGQPFPWKLLISSTTNVAVDRILNGLLDLGFEDFVRVGSVKKISKPVLPFSVHASGTDNQELKDLQEMLRSGELTNTEKSNVRQSIEKHRRGENKKKLGRVRVVGATCAACSLNCLNQMEFPLVLLDECSQMTEPASLLPVAKFGCQKLLLVGDPKQLDPTLQSCESAHENGLEQTLFDRLIKMGCIPTLLRRQYRCHPYISAIPNNLFYGGMLEDGVSIDNRKPLLDILPTVCCYDVDTGQECCESFGSYYNEHEAQFVVFLLKVLLSTGIESSNVGVITLYKSQMSRISDLLSGLVETIDMKGIQVSTVDAFQGGERDIIILSTVRTNACGFIDNDKRTNVALTRAKYHLLIVGNVNNLTRNLLWSKVLSHCKSHANGIQSAEKTRKEFQLYLDQLNESRLTQDSHSSCSGSVASTVDSGKPVQKKRGRKRKVESNVGITEKEKQSAESIDITKSYKNNSMEEYDVLSVQDNVGDGLENEDMDMQTPELVTLKSDYSIESKSKKISDRLKKLSDHLEEDELPDLT